METYLGLDLGGTKLLIGKWTAAGIFSSIKSTIPVILIRKLPCKYKGIAG